MSEKPLDDSGLEIKKARDVPDKLMEIVFKVDNLDLKKLSNENMKSPSGEQIVSRGGYLFTIKDSELTADKPNTSIKIRPEHLEKNKPNNTPNSLHSEIDIKNWLTSMDIKNYKLVKGPMGEWCVNVKGDVYLKNKRLTKLPVKFGTVSGDFDISDNEMATLEGCPAYVEENFYCSNNKLINMEGAPIKNYYKNSLRQLIKPLIAP